MNDSYKQYARLLAIGLPLVLIGLAFGWYAYQTDPHHVFSDMLRNNLTTSAVTKTMQSSKADSSNIQQVNVQSGAQTYSRWVTTVKNGNSTVKTDSLGAISADYVRYTRITDKNGKPAYQSAVDVWAKTASRNSTTEPSLFGSSILDLTLAPVPPVGNIAKTQRDDMLAYIATQQVFKTDFGKVKLVTVNGRRAYEYPVSVKLAPYVRLMQSFAHAYGLTELDELSATQYQAAQPVDIRIAVDVWSHRMIRISFPASGFSETFTDYGISKRVQLPAKTITGSELKSRFDGRQ
jgi:hypothetical protein